MEWRGKEGGGLNKLTMKQVRLGGESRSRVEMPVVGKQGVW